MNLDPKILLTIFIEGVLSQEKEDVKINVSNTRNINGNILVKNSTHVEIFKKRIPFKAVKRTVISTEAYKAMTDNDSAPDWYRPNRNHGTPWRSLSKDDRVKLHCERIAYPHTFSFTYIDK